MMQRKFYKSMEISGTSTENHVNERSRKISISCERIFRGMKKLPDIFLKSWNKPGINSNNSARRSGMDLARLTLRPYRLAAQDTVFLSRALHCVHGLGNLKVGTGVQIPVGTPRKVPSPEFLVLS